MILKILNCDFHNPCDLIIDVGDILSYVYITMGTTFNEAIRAPPTPSRTLKWLTQSQYTDAGPTGLSIVLVLGDISKS